MIAPFAALALAAAAPADTAPPLFRDASLVPMQALAVALVDTLRGRGVASPRGTLTVTMDAGGANASLNVEDRNFPGELRAALAPPTVAFIRSRGMDEPLQLTVILDRVEPVDAWLPGVERTLPVLRNGRRVDEYMHRIFEAQPALRRGTYTVQADLLVNRQGRVAVAYVRGRSAEDELDQYIPALALQLEFTPATANGIAAPMWVRQSFTFGIP
jgi:hypothetical protein